MWKSFGQIMDFLVFTYFYTNPIWNALVKKQ
jgi:hypothetical protein